MVAVGVGRAVAVVGVADPVVAAAVAARRVQAVEAVPAARGLQLHAAVRPSADNRQGQGGGWVRLTAAVQPAVCRYGFSAPR